MVAVAVVVLASSRSIAGNRGARRGDEKRIAGVAKRAIKGRCVER